MKLIPTAAGAAPVLLDDANDNVILGRQPRQGVKVEHATVSREHARVFARDGRWQVADLNSSNGTFVNDRKVTREALSHGDLLRLGEVEFRVDLSQAAAPGPLPARPSVADIFGDAPPPVSDRGASDHGARDRDGDDDDGGIVLEDPADAEPRAAVPSFAPDQTMIVPAAPLFRAGPSGGPSAPPTGANRPKALEHMAVQTRDRRGAGAPLLKQDVAQFGGLRQALLVIVVLVVCGALFLFVMRLTEEVVPEGGIPPQAAPADVQDE